MPGNSSEKASVDFRTNKTNRLIVFNYLSSTSSKNKLRVPTTTTNKSIKNTRVILQKSDSKQKLQGRTGVVDTKFESVQWSLLDSVSQSSADTGRCIYKGMGCDMSRDINRESMVKGGTAVTHSTFEFQQTKIFESSSFSNRQHRCTTLPSNVTKIKQKNLAASLETPDHNYCRIPSKFFECGSRSICIKTVSPTTLVHCLET